MPTTKRLVAVAGSNRSTLLSVTSSPCSDWRIGSIMRRASGVGVMAWPWRDEQRIVEHQPHAAERVADRGLREVEASAGARDAALRVDGIEHHEQVQVDLG